MDFNARAGMFACRTHAVICCVSSCEDVASSEATRGRVFQAAIFAPRSWHSSKFSAATDRLRLAARYSLKHHRNTTKEVRSNAAESHQRFVNCSVDEFEFMAFLQPAGCRATKPSLSLLWNRSTVAPIGCAHFPAPRQSNLRLRAFESPDLSRWLHPRLAIR